MRGERWERGAYGVACTKLHFLDGGTHALAISSAELGLDLLAAMSNDDDHLGDACFERCINDPSDHALFEQLMEDLRASGAHTLPVARGEDDRDGVRFFHALRVPRPALPSSISRRDGAHGYRGHPLRRRGPRRTSRLRRDDIEGDRTRPDRRRRAYAHRRAR